ncbi:hypothetical protein GIB67_025140, partial [Kingdonia uniflora]
MNMKSEHERIIPFDQSPKFRRKKSREVSSRFLSPTSSTDSGIPSPSKTLSPIKKNGTKQLNVEDNGIIHGLRWPSSSSSKKSSGTGTLADHLGNERLKDFMKNDDKSGTGPQFLNRQRSCTEFSRFDKEKDNNLKENRPIGGSMRFTGKLRFPGKSSSSSSSTIVSGRHSVDETALSQISSRRISDSFADTLSSDSECSDIFSGSEVRKKKSSFSSSALSYLSSTASSRRSGVGVGVEVEVSSRYLQDRRSSYDSNSSTNSPNINNLPPKNGVKRTNSLTSQWASSPGRSGSPPILVDTKGKPITSFSSLRPSNSLKAKGGVGNLFNLGLDLFKSKKSSTNCSSPPLGHGSGENSHQLRLLHNRLIQWQYVNARADVVNQSKTTQVENNLLNTSGTISRLQSSMLQMHTQFENEKLELKLNTILESQLRPLEAWGDFERQHLSAVSETKDCLHSVVCRVPLIDGAKMNPQLASIALRRPSDLTASIQTMLTDLTPMAQETGSSLSELADVVSQEKSFLEECFELLEIVSTLEVKERSLKCSLVQLKSQQQERRLQE